MNRIMAQPSSAHPTPAEIITRDLARLVADEQQIQRVIGICLTLQRQGLLTTTREAGALYLGRIQRELALVRAAKRHLQHQARLEGLDICDACGAVGVTGTYRADIGQWWHECVSCRKREAAPALVRETRIEPCCYDGGCCTHPGVPA